MARSRWAGRCCAGSGCVARRLVSSRSSARWSNDSPRVSCRPGLAGAGLVGQRERVDAVAQPGVGGSVGEHVPQMPAAPGAQDLGAGHAQDPVGPLDDGPGRAGPVEAGPARPGLELRVRVEQLRTTAGAAEDALSIDVQQFSRPGWLGAGPAQHRVAVPGQLLPPFVVRLGDLVGRLVVLLAREHGAPLSRQWNRSVVGTISASARCRAQAASAAAALPMRKRKLSA